MNKKRKNIIILFMPLMVFLLEVSSGVKPEGALSPRFKKWLEEEVCYIITPLEKEVFLQLQTDRERDFFIEAFWKHRDPTSGTPENEFKEEHYRRINYANHHFGRDGPWPGWKTDRGRIFIILGEPRGIDHYTGDTQICNTEVWFYQGLTQYGLPSGFNLVFFQKDGVGEYVLYSPSADGPQALLTSFYGDQADYVQAFQTLRKINPSLAKVSLSLIPGESSYGHPSLASDMLIQNIHTVPQKELKDNYAQKFLAYKDIVEVEYSANYIDNDSSIKILQNPPGVYFVHYVVEIMKFSLQQYQDKYSTHLKINGNVSDSEGKTIHQYEGSISVELDEDQLKSIAYKPFDIYDMFPLTAGFYKFSVIIKNEVSKEFTTLEKDIIIPEDDSALGMSSLVLGYKMEQASPETQNLKAFKLGSFQILHQPKNIFRPQDTLFLAFQITGLSSDLRQRGHLKYKFFKGDEPFLNFTEKVSQYERGVNFRHEFSLQEFPPDYYRLHVGLWDGEQEILSEEENFGISSISDFPRPWIHTKTLPPPDHPVYSFLLGKQLFSKGNINKAQAKLEEAFQKKPDSLDFALSLAQVYFVQKKHHQVKQLLMAFSDVSEVPYQLYLLLGKSHQALEEFDQAIAVYNKAISRYGIILDLLNSTGECYYSLGIWDKALAAWEKSLEINNHQPDIKKKVDILKQKISELD
jgi:GWxTD domain-containing protein